MILLDIDRKPAGLMPHSFGDYPHQAANMSMRQRKVCKVRRP
jgi:hypothetical protein